MVIRDRNRPSVIIWGTRLNETRDSPGLYARTRQLARELDGSRPSSGTMTRHSTRDWSEDVFAFDDYRMVDEHAAPRPPLDGVPYLVTEAVGVLSGGDRVWDSLKTPGVIDSFRVAKPGAAFYRSQADPGEGPVILPAFCWGPGRGGPDQAAIIFTNCDRLELYVGGQHAATGLPDRQRFADLAHPPVFAGLSVGASRSLLPGLPEVRVLPDLRIDGYVGGRKVAATTMSADPSLDRLSLTADHTAIEADGSDATRITFRATDAHGNHRRGAAGNVALTVTGPADLIGVYGPVGGAFVRSRPGRAGLVTVSAAHPVLGRATVQIASGEPDRQ